MTKTKLLLQLKKVISENGILKTFPKKEGRENGILKLASFHPGNFVTCFCFLFSNFYSYVCFY